MSKRADWIGTAQEACLTFLELAILIPLLTLAMVLYCAFRILYGLQDAVLHLCSKIVGRK